MKTDIKCVEFRNVAGEELTAIDGGNPALIGFLAGYFGQRAMDYIVDGLSDGPGLVDIVKAAQSGKPLRG